MKLFLTTWSSRVRMSRHEVDKLSDGQKEGDRQMKMKKHAVIFFVVFLVCVVVALNLAWGQEKNLDVNKEVTAKIGAFDREFFKGFDVYSAGEKEAPTALLFDIKDDYNLPAPYWGSPLNEEQIIYAIHSLDEQYRDNKAISFPPRALNIVNLKGKVLGYVFTSLNAVLMDRKKDGKVIVYPPRQIPRLPLR
jgi:hypothetical protein